MASSSSRQPYGWKYDVFMSFRGPDTRHGFTTDLRHALSNKGIMTFMDTRLEKGTPLEPALLGAIERSWISIVVFSLNYAGSRWCLDEPLKIMECHRNNAQVVVPIFYCVEPFHVRHQRGAFGDGYKRLAAVERNHSDPKVSCGGPG
ncbi:hypothetical protein RIF29_31342 [Crotalaria pallida]|uniref:TIR domain-containing protein n=1 Tax=Crotalaria pallida TaxID=3830 RepID=A0AAN9HXI2_CROPI